MVADLQLVDLGALCDAIVFYEPYTFFLVASLLKPDAIADLRRELPGIPFVGREPYG